MLAGQGRLPVMELLIVRHADAGDREEFATTGQPDHLRPLTRKGHKQMRAVAAALVQLVPRAAIIVTSPYVRAVETQRIVSEAYGDTPRVETTETLEPERPPADFAKWLRAQDAATVIAVGHEPQLSTAASWFMGLGDSRIELKKAGACLLELDDQPAKGAGTLRWLMTARQLKVIGQSTD